MCVEELKNTELDESTENSCKCSDTDEEVTVSEVAEEIVEEAAKSNETTEELKEDSSFEKEEPVEGSSSNDENFKDKSHIGVKGWVKIVAVVAMALLLIIAGLVSFIMIVSRDMTLELGAEKKFDRIQDSKLISSVCSVVNDNVDTDKLGEYNVSLRYFGFINKGMTVNVVDTTAPELQLYDLRVPVGTNIDAELFVKKESDLTDTDVMFEGKAPLTDKAGSVEVEILCKDSSGNKTVKKAKLYLLGEAYSFVIEYGDNEYITKIRNKYSDVTDEELSVININEVGHYSVEFIRDNTYNVFNVFVDDTVPPEVVLNTLVVRKGEAIRTEDLVVSVNDKSEVAVAFKVEHSSAEPGVYDVTLVFTDAYENVTESTTQIAVCDIPSELVLEHGFTKYDLTTKIFENVGSEKGTLALATPFDSIVVGDNKLTLSGEYGSLDLKLTVTDHKAPQLVLKELRSYVGVEVTAKDFVKSCYDASSVEFLFVSAPSVSATGSFPVTIIAKDACGNVTEKQTYLHIAKDTLPPVIYGVKNITVRSGGTVSYKNGVYAVDSVCGNVDVNVDSSKVNLNAQGRYPVVYSATDNSGNTSTITVYVTVTGISYDTIYAMADRILASIINDSMTDRDKAWAIYSWVTSNFRYSTRTSYLMGNFVEGAYSGFSIKSGNCYIYYAVTSTLLTRAGIENIEIQRNDPSNPHYWNLVKINGAWYHLDTCPHYAGHKMTAFLLTDAQVKAYSVNEVAGYYSFDESKYPDTP